MTGGTFLCLSVVLLVNKFHYWLAGSKNTTYVVKTSLFYKINDPVMKTLVFVFNRNDLFIKLFLDVYLIWRFIYNRFLL